MLDSLWQFTSYWELLEWDFCASEYKNMRQSYPNGNLIEQHHRQRLWQYVTSWHSEEVLPNWRTSHWLDQKKTRNAELSRRGLTSSRRMTEDWHWTRTEVSWQREQDSGVSWSPHHKVTNNQIFYFSEMNNYKVNKL